MKVVYDKFASDNERSLCLFYDAAFEHCKGKILLKNLYLPRLAQPLKLIHKDCFEMSLI